MSRLRRRRYKVERDEPASGGPRRGTEEARHPDWIARASGRSLLLVEPAGCAGGCNHSSIARNARGQYAGRSVTLFGCTNHKDILLQPEDGYTRPDIRFG